MKNDKKILGNIISKGIVKSDLSKIDTIRNHKRPINIRQLVQSYNWNLILEII